MAQHCCTYPDNLYNLELRLAAHLYKSNTPVQLFPPLTQPLPANMQKNVSAPINGPAAA